MQKSSCSRHFLYLLFKKKAVGVKLDATTWRSPRTGTCETLPCGPACSYLKPSLCQPHPRNLFKLRYIEREREREREAVAVAESEEKKRTVDNRVQLRLYAREGRLRKVEGEELWSTASPQQRCLDFLWCVMEARTTKPWGGGGGWNRHPSVSETTISLSEASFQETLRSLHGELQKLLWLSHGKTGPRSL